MGTAFLTLTKVDQAQRMVYGRIDETPDRSGEVFDYDSSKPYFVSWSEAISKATQGRSAGNIRAMHGNVAAGLLKSVQFDDEQKAIILAAQIIDDSEWAKVQAGVYTGFSPGGSYIRKWDDGGYVRYTAQPSEISIVDLPCIPSAHFEVLKADGATEQRPFVLRKGMNDVQRLAELIDQLAWLATCSAWDAQGERDGSAIPIRLRDWLLTGTQILKDMTQEECTEALSALAVQIAAIPAAPVVVPDDAMAMAASATDLVKKGARNNSADLESIQGIHDHAVGLGAMCSGASKAADAPLKKVTAELELAKGDVLRLKGELEVMAKKVADFEAQPQPGGPLRLDIYDKAPLSGGGDAAEIDRIEKMANSPEKARLLIKLSQRTPI